MGTKYSSNVTSGYNAIPPADDGTVSEANKIKWSTVKTKLSDPVKDLADTINTELGTHFDRGPTALTSNTTLGASHYNQFIQVSGSGVTLTLTDAATLAAAWYCDIVNTDTANSVTLARATAANTIDASSNDITIFPLERLRVFVNAATTGFLTLQESYRALGRQQIPVNFSPAVSMAANAVTFAIKDEAGNDPTTRNVVWLPFRSATLTTPTITWRPVTSALSLAVSSGSTLGTTSGEISRIWYGAFDDAGTIRPFVINCSTSTNVFNISNHSIASSTAEGGAGGADSAGVFYTGTAVTSKPYIILGYWESTQATAGTWATAASTVMTFVPGMKLPGDVVQTANTQTGAFAAGTPTAMPSDDTIPQNTEGDQFMSLAITPKFAGNILKIDTVYNWANADISTKHTCALFKDSVANALAAVVGFTPSATNPMTPLKFTHWMLAGGTAEITFKIRGGASSGGYGFNGSSSARLYGGVMASSITITEFSA